MKLSEIKEGHTVRLEDGLTGVVQAGMGTTSSFLQADNGAIWVFYPYQVVAASPDGVEWHTIELTEQELASKDATDRVTGEIFGV